MGQLSGEFSESHLTWLKEMLSQNNSENIFIMMHQPVLNTDLYGDKWDVVADLLKDYPVRAVFAGHKHYYRDWGLRDGVRYFITGGGGGDRIGVPEEKGAFPHYLLCKVRGNNVNFTGIKPGSFFASDSITQKRIGEMENLSQAIKTEPLEVLYGENLDRDSKIIVENPYNWAMNLDVKWNKQQGWEIEPKKL